MDVSPGALAAPVGMTHQPESSLVWRAGWGWVSRPVEQPEPVAEQDEDAA
jgi:hypothetical protein